MKEHSIYEKVMLSLLEEARKFRFSVVPNPCVGAALLYEDSVVATGYHEIYGDNHAEINCIEEAKKKGIDITKCTLLVTLEPCTHYGNTPPCVQRIIDEKIRRVVVAAKDPTSCGGGIEILRDKGIEVIDGIAENEAIRLLADFLVLGKTEFPCIIIKLAVTLDGYIATPMGESQWITNALSREYVHNVRKGIGENSGAILVGGQTLRIDNPHLYSKNSDTKQQPYPLVYTRTLEGIKESYLYTHRRKNLVVCTKKEILQSQLAKDILCQGVTLWALSENNMGLDILEGMKKARKEKGSRFILCEGGGKLAFSLLTAGIPLEIQLFYAPRIFADSTSYPVFSGNRISLLQESHTVELCSMRNFASDVLLSYHNMEMVSLCSVCK
ncbi:MAG: bifunctional diaminohydroxyphosphoribosylaminopyrimidine deaminase/5-amino-6-(5-phosphoribosylamino)uracil reductase RibD [Desulfovibrionaceae bacterium]